MMSSVRSFERRAKSRSVLFLIYREALGPIFSSVYVRPAAKLSELGIRAQFLVISSAGEFIKWPLRRRWNALAKETRRHVPDGVTRLPSPPARLLWLSTDPVALRLWAALNFKS